MRFNLLNVAARQPRSIFARSQYPRTSHYPGSFRAIRLEVYHIPLAKLIRECWLRVADHCYRQELISEFAGVLDREAEDMSKHSSFMLATRVLRVQAIPDELLEIDDGLIATR